MQYNNVTLTGTDASVDWHTKDETQRQVSACANLETCNFCIPLFKLPPQFGNQVDVGTDALRLRCRQALPMFPPWTHWGRVFLLFNRRHASQHHGDVPYMGRIQLADFATEDAEKDTRGKLHKCLNMVVPVNALKTMADCKQR